MNFLYKEICMIVDKILKWESERKVRGKFVQRVGRKEKDGRRVLRERGR